MRLNVWSIRRREGGAVSWVKAGVAFVNKDESINVILDVWPIDGRLHVREIPADRHSPPPFEALAVAAASFGSAPQGAGPIDGTQQGNPMGNPIGSPMGGAVSSAVSSAVNGSGSGSMGGTTNAGINLADVQVEGHS